ncbi:hypothetical protein G7Y89_g5386 [Cudoniella acicularis]|uniref:Uncharacterized protein n=1 Tax=Cudoniella acicularis TaxID=354080 RepID=A0A8H4W3U7_9HELO|nr:hypothetical protein G7Y89_g5386 [Cudoniella acicularis]
MALDKYTACPSNDTHSPMSEADSESTLFLDGTTVKEQRRKTHFTFNRILLGLVIVLVGLNGISILLLMRPTTKPEPDYYLTNSAGHTKPATLTHIYHDYDDEYLNFNVSIAQKYWAELFPPGGGIIGLEVQEASAMGLHTSIQGKSDPTKHLYLVAAFHQLHCLVRNRPPPSPTTLLSKFTVTTPLDNNETIPRSNFLHQRGNLPSHNALRGHRSISRSETLKTAHEHFPYGDFSVPRRYCWPCIKTLQALQYLHATLWALLISRDHLTS